MTARIGRAKRRHLHVPAGTPDFATKPFLKWAGGKGQLLDTYDEVLPHAMRAGNVSTYVEPFLGGGAVFFFIAQRYPVPRARLSDINQELVLTYRVVQRDVNGLIERLAQLAERYARLGDRAREKLYYTVRDEYNADRQIACTASCSGASIGRAAQMIFLNKTCFNGLYRLNRKGEFNVPWGRYKNPRILDEENLRNASLLLQRAEILAADFEATCADVRDGAFVYLDPPYRPISSSSSFTAYSRDAFSDAEQIRLATLFRRLHDKGVLLMLSNSDPRNKAPADRFFDELYNGFTIRRVLASRMINSKADRRGAITELLITNY